MSNRSVGRPEPDEIPSHYVGYVKRVSEHDPLIVCAEQIEATAALLQPLSDTDAMYRYEHGKWSIKEVVGHLCDTERVFAYRALRIGRGDTTPLARFDDDAYVLEMRAGDRTLAHLAEEWNHVTTAGDAVMGSA